jgi:N-acetylmuramoyl-L-alanine amidase
MNAMVRVEVFSLDKGASVGSAFLVQGIDRVYVITSAHVFGKELEDEGEKECVPFSIEVKLYQRERNGEPLEHENCAWLLGRDLALVPVHERSGGYPTLELRTREFHQWDDIYIAGYPNGYELDTTTAGMVRSVHAVNDLVMTNALSLPGMSGGPYLSESGYAVGLHTGGLSFVSGAAHFTSLKRVRERLEPYLGPLKEEQAATPDLSSVADSVAVNAELGQLVALRAVSGGEKRVQLWQTFSGRSASSQEAQFLKSLPDAKVNGIKPDALAVLEKDSQQDRLAIAGSLASISVATQAGCLGGSISLVDGILECGGISNYLPTKNVGTVIEPQLIVLHSTLTRSLKQTVETLLDSSMVASVHFLIDRDGAVVQLAPANREASHAGRDSRWGEFKGLNRYSVSIDFINMGQLNKDDREGFKDYTGADVSADDVQAIDGPFETTYWQRFTGPQVAVAQALAGELNRHYKIQAIAGHCNVLADRKADPGPAFPIKEFGNTVLGKSEPDCAPVGSRH